MLIDKGLRKFFIYRFLELDNKWTENKDSVYFLKPLTDLFDSKQSFAGVLRNSFSSTSSALLENLLHFWAILKHVVQTWSDLFKMD